MSHSDPVNRYISSENYITQLEFDHIQTYSFQRGKDYDDRAKEYADLAGLRNPSMEQRQRMDQILSCRHENGFLLDNNGQLNKSSVLISKFKPHTPQVEQILKCLKIEAIDVPMWMCGPFYRDAIVFCDISGNIVSVLNICFSCQYMAIKNLHHINVNADKQTYEELEQLLLGMGHPIEKR